MMTQEEIEAKIFHLKLKIARNEIENDKICEDIRELNKEANDIIDEHVLIPKIYKSIDEWINDHPFPDFVNSMIFKNKSEAKRVQLSCNTYQDSYHVLRR